MDDSGGVKRSFSTPCEGEDCHAALTRCSKTPPLTPKRSGKMLALKILLLDDTVTIIQAQTKALGRVVFDQICKQLNVLEADYFGLEYQDHLGTKFWLDLEKRLSRQVGLSLVDPSLKFAVKFYTPDPSQLEEEFTRYLFSLQVKRDLAQGILVCNENTAALMASFLVQAECGDFSEEDYPDASYLSTFKFIPGQDREMEKRIRENHKKHIGKSPAEADLYLLETARRTELFGIKMFKGKDEEGVPLNISVNNLGILIFQQLTKINTFSWAKIRKISFKRKRFILKLHPESGFGYYKETVEFFFETRNECKSFWKRCVEHHAFFRCEKAPGGIERGGLLNNRGSSFRYSGRTQKQMISFVRDNFVKRAGSAAPLVPGEFQRSASFRAPSSAVSTSASSPAICHQTNKQQSYEQCWDEESASPGTSATSSPAHTGVIPPQDPEWIYWLSKEVITDFRVYSAHLALLDPKLPNKIVLKTLASFETKKELFELRHAIEIFSVLTKTFEAEVQVGKFEPTEIRRLFSVPEEFTHFIPVRALALRPIYRIHYFVRDVIPMLENSGQSQLASLGKRLGQALRPLSQRLLPLEHELESEAKADEVSREMAGAPSDPGTFYRQGILLKLNKKRGLQSRIFFLFRDYLLYGTRVSSAVGFRLHGIVRLYGAQVMKSYKDFDDEFGPLEAMGPNAIPHSFSIVTSEEKVLVLAALSQEDKNVWIRDLVQICEKLAQPRSATNFSSSEELLGGSEREPSVVSHRANSTLHVTWHRSVTCSHLALCAALRVGRAGYLLRKFKNSSGWQKLFVVLVQTCLFFYKSSEGSEGPLASLPLLGYRVEEAPEEGKDNVFKLVFKNHVYLFRTDSRFGLERWTSGLSTACTLSDG